MKNIDTLKSILTDFETVDLGRVIGGKEFRIFHMRMRRDEVLYKIVNYSKAKRVSFVELSYIFEGETINCRLKE